MQRVVALPIFVAARRRDGQYDVGARVVLLQQVVCFVLRETFPHRRVVCGGYGGGIGRGLCRQGDQHAEGRRLTRRRLTLGCLFAMMRRARDQSRVVSLLRLLFHVLEGKKRSTITNGVERLPFAYSAVFAAAHLSTMTEC